MEPLCVSGPEKKLYSSIWLIYCLCCVDLCTLKDFLDLNVISHMVHWYEIPWRCVSTWPLIFWRFPFPLLDLSILPQKKHLKVPSEQVSICSSTFLSISCWSPLMRDILRSIFLEYLLFTVTSSLQFWSLPLYSEGDSSFNLVSFVFC